MSLQAWDWIHRWTSLVCTAFMLLLCLTGLPLIFHRGIDHAPGVEIEPRDIVEPARRASLDEVIATAQRRHPDKMLLFASQEEDDDRLWFVTLGPDAASRDVVQVAVDARTAQKVGEPVIGGEGFMAVMLSLHVDLFAGLPGKLFLGAMGLLLILSIVSGIVLYPPFMQKLRFGDVRRERAPRIKWLDLHNLLGIVTLTWALVVGATGVINTWADLLVKYWQATELSAMIASHQGGTLAERPPLLQASVDKALALEPHLKVRFIAFPGSSFSTERHYGIFLRGDSPLTSRLVKRVRADAGPAEVSDRRDLPWYLTALLLSQPLHFGDYGGMPMKILWAALDLVTIVVLGSGLYLYVARRRRAVPVRQQVVRAAEER